MEVLKLLTVLWRRRLALVLSTALFLVVAVIATVLLPEQYTAETQVIVEGDDSTTSLLNDLGLSEMAMSLTTADDDIMNKIYLSTSQPMMDEIIWKLQLRNGNGELYGWDDVAAASLLAPVFGTPTITVTQTQGTDVLVIEATGPTPEAARLMADTLAEVYIEKQTQQAREEFGEAEKFIHARLEEVTNELDEAYSELAQAQKATSIIDLDTEQRAAVSRLSEFVTEREMVFSRIKEVESKIQAQKEFRRQESVESGVSSASMNSNPVIGKLRTNLSDLYTLRQGLLLNHYTERAPEVVEIDAKVESVKAQLAQALTEQHALDPELAASQAELDGLIARQHALSDAIDRTQEEGTAYPELRRQFSRLQLQAAAAEEVYGALQDQAFQIGIAQAMTMADIRVTARAELPEDPSSPKAVLNLLAGLVLGIAFGCASALVSEYLDDSITEADDVKGVWEVPVLGVLPRYKTAAGPALTRVAATDPLSEAHRALRNGIDFATLDKPARLLGITSSIPGEGKSTLVMNLAIAMASEGRRVLVVDGDLRLPTQHRHFPDLVSSPGLVEVITRSQQPQDVIQRTPIEGVDVLAAGSLPPNPGHLVESLRMRQVLLELARSYDVVLVDTPPVLAVNDAVVLGRLVDALLVVVEANRATRRMLTEVKTRLEGARVAATGLVLNKVRSGALHYGEYARYYQQQKRAPDRADRPPSAKGGAA